MSDKPAFVARKFQDAQRLAAKGYSCPLCSDTFHADLKLWEHAKTCHPQELGPADPADDEKARKRFRREAIEKAYVVILRYFEVLLLAQARTKPQIFLNNVDGPST